MLYDDFRIRDRWTGQDVHVQFMALVVAIATRHADAVDIKFMVGGRPVWVALPHMAWVEHKQKTGNVITDPMAVQAAGHYLKEAMESGMDSAREMYTLTIDETLRHLDAVLNQDADAA